MGESAILGLRDRTQPNGIQGESPMIDNHVYLEHVSSNKTEALFVALMLLSLLLFAWRVMSTSIEAWGIIFFCLFAFFLFYSLNYRTLLIRLDAEALQLKFGLFMWRIPLRNIQACFPDKTTLWRIGGAGIHFTPLQGRYRAMFNFLEHPRLVVALKVKKGPVQDIAFSTRSPDVVMHLIQEGSLERGDSAA
jgi:Ca2+/Na+ antiporter